MNLNPLPARGDIWKVDFEPQVGQEIRKLSRPSVVLNINAQWRLRYLYIVVPLTEWKPNHANEFWMTLIKATSLNNLDKDSGADAFQIKSVSDQRFSKRIGRVTPAELDEIVAAVAVCIGV